MATMQDMLTEFMCAPTGSAYVAEIIERMTAAGYELRKRPSRNGKSDKSPAEQFHDALAAAKRNATADCVRWDLRDDCVWLDLPGRLRTFRFKRPDGSMSLPIKCRRDHKAPAAQYWPDGVIPAGVEIGQ